MEKATGAVAVGISQEGLSLMTRSRAAASEMFGSRLTSAGEATMVASSVAVQAVFMAEISESRKAGEEQFVSVDFEDIRARVFGMGQGIGMVLGGLSLAGNQMVDLYVEALHAGMASGMAKRSAQTHADWAKRPKGAGDA